MLCEQLLLRPGSVVAVTVERVTDAFALPHTAPGAAAGGSAEGGVLYLVTRLRIVKLSREVALAGDAALASRLAEVRRGAARRGSIRRARGAERRATLFLFRSSSSSSPAAPFSRCRGTETTTTRLPSCPRARQRRRLPGATMCGLC